MQSSCAVACLYWITSSPAMIINVQAIRFLFIVSSSLYWVNLTLACTSLEVSGWHWWCSLHPRLVLSINPLLFPSPVSGRYMRIKILWIYSMHDNKSKLIARIRSNCCSIIHWRTHEYLYEFLKSVVLKLFYWIYADVTQCLSSQIDSNTFRSCCCSLIHYCPLGPLSLTNVARLYPVSCTHGRSKC